MFLATAAAITLSAFADSADAGRWTRRGKACTSTYVQSYYTVSVTATQAMEIHMDPFKMGPDGPYWVVWGPDGLTTKTDGRIWVQLKGDDKLIRTLEGEQATVVFKCEIGEGKEFLVRMQGPIDEKGRVMFTHKNGSFGKAFHEVISERFSGEGIEYAKTTALLRTAETLVFEDNTEALIYKLN